MFTQDSKKPFNIVCNLYIICNSQKLVSSFHREKKDNFKPCLTKQLVNVFKLWCECECDVIFRTRRAQLFVVMTMIVTELQTFPTINTFPFSC